MKKYYIILVALVAVFATTSCSEVPADEKLATTPNREIRFTATVEDQTRVSGNMFEVGDQISVLGFAYEPDVSYEADPYIKNVCFTLGNDYTFAAEGCCWHENINSKTRFFAFYPYNSDLSNVTNLDEGYKDVLVSVQEDQRGGYAASDMLCAYGSEGSYLSGVPQLNFRRMHSMLIFNIENNTNDSVVGLTVRNITPYLSLRFTFDEYYEIYFDTFYYGYSEDNVIDIQAYNEYDNRWSLILPPQYVNSLVIDVAFKSGSVKNYNIVDMPRLNSSRAYFGTIVINDAMAEDINVDWVITERTARYEGLDRFIIE